MDQLPAILPFMIPILGLLLGFVVVAAIFVVQPIVNALTKLSERPQALAPVPEMEAELRSLARRVGSLEDTLGRIEEERRFDRELGAGEARRPGLDRGE